MQVRALSLTMLVSLLAACGGDDTGSTSCDTEVPACEASMPATYDAVYDQVLSKSCGATGTGGSCHGPAGAQGGLVLASRDAAYDYLLGDIDDRARVTPGGPACSSLMQRLDSDDSSYRMPQGAAKLSEGVRCAVRQWIAMGAER